MVAEQLQNVRAEIRKACEKSGRNPEEVTLIAVSKTKPISMIREAMDAGQTIFGRNKGTGTLHQIRKNFRKISNGI